MDSPPHVPFEDRLSDREMAALALSLLREMAADDPALAKRMHQLGLDPGSPMPDFASARR